MILTAKVNLKKIMLVLVCIAAVLLAAILLFENRSETTAAKQTLSLNEARVKFLTDFGWEVAPNPTESTVVRIPEEVGEMFRRYNTLQKGQGYDLTKFSGKKAMRYVYEVKNYPGATAPVYATLLTVKNQIIGGDITDTSANGKIRGFQMPPAAPPTMPSQHPTEETNG